MKIAPTAILVALTAGASVLGGPSPFGVTPTAAQEVPAKEIQTVFRFGGANAAPEYAFAAAPRLVVDSAGYIFARVSSDASVTVFDPNGRFVRTIGRQGEGPGEFQVAAGHGLLADTLWISNWPAPRISRFLKDGTHLRTTRTPFEFDVSFAAPAGITALLSGGRVFVRPPSFPNGVRERIQLPVLIANGDGTDRDTIALVPLPNDLFIPNVGNWAYQPIPMSPLVAVAGDGLEVAVAEWSDTLPGILHVRVIAADGSPRWSRQLHIRTSAITRRERDNIIAEGLEKAQPQLEAARRRGMALGGSPRDLVERGLSLPRYYAPASRILVGVDGSVWIEQMTGLRGGTWLVLDRGGNPRFRLEVPDNARVEAGTLSSAWAVERDEMGVSYMVRYRIADPAGGAVRE